MSNEKAKETLTAADLALSIWNFIDDWQNTDNYTEAWQEAIMPFLVKTIKEAESAARAEAIVEFCEGDRSKLAIAEQEAYAKGFADAQERAANIASCSKSSADPIEIAFKIRLLKPQ